MKTTYPKTSRIPVHNLLGISDLKVFPPTFGGFKNIFKEILWIFICAYEAEIKKYFSY